LMPLPVAEIWQPPAGPYGTRLVGYPVESATAAKKDEMSATKMKPNTSSGLSRTTPGTCEPP